MESSHNRIFIFLDIDGVLNTASQWKRMYQLDDGCISRFNEYIRVLSEKGAVRIILTSSWKNGFDSAGHHTPQIQALIAKLDIPILGKTENRAGGDRAAEINNYICNHKLEHEECIVIDDDPDLFKSKLFENCKFVITDACVGFNNPQAPSEDNQGVSQRILHLFQWNPPFCFDCFSSYKPTKNNR